MMIVNFIKAYPFSIIWLIFSGLFLYMAYREWKKSKQLLDSLKSAFFNNPQLGLSSTIQFMGVSFESFAKELQKSNQESHRIAATSYFLAGLTALASLIISLL